MGIEPLITGPASTMLLPIACLAARSWQLQPNGGPRRAHNENEPHPPGPPETATPERYLGFVSSEEASNKDGLGGGNSSTQHVYKWYLECLIYLDIDCLSADM